MEKHLLLFHFFVFSIPFFHAYVAFAAGTADGSEQWGYVEVRPKAHMFWWLYKSPYRVQEPSKPWPTILWLPAGPGVSGVGFGNFLEMGPLDNNLQPRNSTWLKKADLLFVDSPVGTGFSYVEDQTSFAKTDEEATTDLTTLLKELSEGNATLRKSHLYIFGESYGGKLAVTLALSAIKAIAAGELNLEIGGIALGNSWISPVDFVFTYGPLLKDVSRLSNNGLAASNRLALKIHYQVADGNITNATATWRNELVAAIRNYSNDVDIFNFMLDFGNDPVLGIDLGDLMNGPIRKKLEIIPANVTWGAQRGLVFQAMMGDFMTPRIQEVDELLAKGVNVTIYNGQLDIICSTKGVDAWINKLKWDGLPSFLRMDRTPLYCGSDKTTQGFVSSYKNFYFYWILGAGHFVPVDQPCVTQQMAGNITDSPSES